jgi:hypothetical protein
VPVPLRPGNGTNRGSLDRRYKNATIQDLQNRSGVTAVESLGSGTVGFGRDRLHPHGFARVRTDAGGKRELECKFFTPDSHVGKNPGGF